MSRARELLKGRPLSRSAVSGLGASRVRSGSLDEERVDTTTYQVVVNHEEQYSIWPADRDNAPGWRDAGKTGSKDECLGWIKEVWTDMRPLSLRQRMDPSKES